MTAARLSPAANLLRNSRLFALPPPIALPAPEPSSEPVPRSDTATTLYPVRAAIETSQAALNSGDWGLKRPLPLKSTLKSGTPTVRLNSSIDTLEHIADFSSAGDHVLTLQKFQELNQPLNIPVLSTVRTGKRVPNVFDRSLDNTVNTSRSAPANIKHSGVWPDVSISSVENTIPENIRNRLHELEESYSSFESPASATPGNSSQDQKRWRYRGPSLVQMSELDFDKFLNTLGTRKRDAFKTEIRAELLQRKIETNRAKARDEGTIYEFGDADVTVSDEELAQYIRRLRQQPDKLGPLVARFLDLPAGPEKMMRGEKNHVSWKYGESSLPSEYYLESGPPRTHPSAGLSYTHTVKHAENDALFGPRHNRRETVARAVRVRSRGARNEANYGVAGFVVRKLDGVSREETNDSAPFQPVKGGMKRPVYPTEASMTEQGALHLSVKALQDYKIENDKAVHYSMTSKPAVDQSDATAESRFGVTAPLVKRPRPEINYRKAQSPEQNEEVDGILKQMMDDAAAAAISSGNKRR